jgi:hypothetical protein
VSPPVKEIDGANAVDGAGEVVAVAAAVVVAAVVEGVVVEFEQAADRTTHRRIPRRETGITGARARTLPAPRTGPSRGFNDLR